MAVHESDTRLLLELGGAYLAIVLVLAIGKFVLRIYQSWISESAIRYNREQLSKIHECRSSAGGGQGQGRAVSVIGPEIDKLGGFVGEGLAQPCVNLGILFAIGGYMIVVEPLVAVFSLPFLVPQLIAVPLLQRTINRLVEKRVLLMRNLSDSVADLPQECGDLAESGLPAQFDRIYGNRMRTFVLKFALKGLINLLNGLAPLSALVFGGLLVIQGQTSIGIVVAFVSGF